MGWEIMAPIRWLGRNISTLLLSFILAAIVWASAVTSIDPNEERIYNVPIEVIGQDTDIEILSDIQEQLLMTLYAPRSILDDINKETNILRAWVDLSGLGRGNHSLTVHYLMPSEIRPLRLVDLSPKSVEISLEELGTKNLPIQTKTPGTPALGYQQGSTAWSDDEVQISGRVSDIERVMTVETSLDITGANEDIRIMVPLLPRDSNGNLVPEVTLTPDRVTVTQTITLLGGYRNMVVKVVTAGQVAEGYRQTNVTVSPPNVMVFSSDLAMIGQLPGYIETELLDLTDAIDDIETVLALNLPENVSVIGDPNITIQVGVAAIEGSVSISRKVEIISIMPGLSATVSPDTVEVIIFGPIPTLKDLVDVDVRVVIDLTGLEEGVYQLNPEAIILPDRLELEVIFPDTLEVEIIKTEQETLNPTPSP
jgi:YbbR domain-containing protein